MIINKNPFLNTGQDDVKFAIKDLIAFNWSDLLLEEIETNLPFRLVFFCGCRKITSILSTNQKHLIYFQAYRVYRRLGRILRHSGFDRKRRDFGLWTQQLQPVGDKVENIATMSLPSKVTSLCVCQIFALFTLQQVDVVSHHGEEQRIFWRPERSRRQMESNRFRPTPHNRTRRAREGRKPHCCCHSILFLSQPSNLRWMPNSVSKGFDTAMKMGSSRQCKRYPTTYRWVSRWPPFTVECGLKAYPALS